MANKATRADVRFSADGKPAAFAQPLHVGRPGIGNREEFLQRVNRILDDQWLSNNGPMVQEFERRVAEYLGVKHCVAVCNGTIALELAIRALGLEGEVIVPSWTFVATAHALHWQGITSVFADIDPATHNLDPAVIRRLITPRTTAILGVHLWGRAAPIDELQAIADEHGLKLLFDAAHAFGSTYKGQGIGRFGSCEVFSFHATKSFNTFEGGAVATNDDAIAESIRLMHNFGFEGYDNVTSPGTNGKMIEICAAMGLTNLDSLADVIAVNKRNHEAYTAALSGIPGVSVLQYDSAERNSYHYVVMEIQGHRSETRDRIIEALWAENVLARKYFWPGLHRMKPYRDLFPNAHLMLPHTERIGERVVVLPNGAAVSVSDIQKIAGIIGRVVAE